MNQQKELPKVTDKPSVICPGETTTIGGITYSSNGEEIWRASRGVHQFIPLGGCLELPLHNISDEEARLCVWVLYLSGIFSKDYAWTSKQIKDAVPQCFPERAKNLPKDINRHGSFGRGLHNLRHKKHPRWVRFEQRGRKYYHWIEITENVSVPVCNLGRERRAQKKFDQLRVAQEERETHDTEAAKKNEIVRNTPFIPPFVTMATIELLAHLRQTPKHRVARSSLKHSAQTIDDALKLRLVQSVEHSMSPYIELGGRGKVYIDALCKVPLPEETWVMPADHQWGPSPLGGLAALLPRGMPPFF